MRFLPGSAPVVENTEYSGEFADKVPKMSAGSVSTSFGAEMK